MWILGRQTPTAGTHLIDMKGLVQEFLGTKPFWFHRLSCVSAPGHGESRGFRPYLAAAILPARRPKVRLRPVALPVEVLM